MIRTFMALVSAFGAFLAAYWAALILIDGDWEGPALWVGAASALGVGWVVWSNTQPGSLIWSAFRGGFILGGIGFVAGFVGPILLTPEANQGPLLGIFFTGPLGFLVGCVGGFGQALLARR